MKRDLDIQNRSRLDFRDRVYDNGFEFPDSRPVIDTDHNETKSASGKILLVLDALIGCDHYVETGLLRHSEEIPVGHFSPTAFIGRLHVMADQPVP